MDEFSKNTQISNFMKIRPVGAELCHEDRQSEGRTDMTKLIVALHNFANAPKKRRYYCVSTAAMIIRSRHVTFYIHCPFYIVMNFRIYLLETQVLHVYLIIYVPRRTQASYFVCVCVCVRACTYVCQYACPSYSSSIQEGHETWWAHHAIRNHPI